MAVGGSLTGLKVRHCTAVPSGVGGHWPVGHSMMTPPQAKPLGQSASVVQLLAQNWLVVPSMMKLKHS
jgi:hypothetical protein